MNFAVFHYSNLKYISNYSKHAYIRTKLKHIFSIVIRYINITNKFTYKVIHAIILYIAKHWTVALLFSSVFSVYAKLFIVLFVLIA